MNKKCIEKAIEKFNTNYRYFHLFSYTDENFINSISVYKATSQKEFDEFIKTIEDSSDNAYIDIIGSGTYRKGTNYYVIRFNEDKNTITIFNLSYLKVVYQRTTDDIENCIEYLDIINFNPKKENVENVSNTSI